MSQTTIQLATSPAAPSAPSAPSTGPAAPLSPAPSRPAQGYAPTGATLAVFALTALLATGQLYGAIPLLAGMGRAWHAPQSAMTWFASAFGFGYATGFLLFGPLSDRFGRRRVIVSGTAATALTTALVATAPGLPAGIALRVLQGLTTAAFAPAAFSYIAERIEPRRRALVLSGVISAFLASAVAGQLSAQTVAGHYGWRAVFLVFAAAFALASALLARVMLADPPPAATAALSRAYRSMPRLLVSRRLLPLYAVTPVILGSFVALYTGLQLSGAAGDAGALLALRAAALPAILALPLLAPVLRRFSGLARTGGALALAAVAALLIAALEPGTVGLALLLNAFVAGSGLAASGMVETIGGRAGEDRVTAVSVYTFVLFLGGSLGPQAASALTGAGIAPLAAALAGLLAAAAAGVAALGRRR
ncbi:MFS transporter [Streptomyces hoynatensis]|uniref:MFS transporter n=1 Tax=Streptomyces hoynatensis TaxID=1141874 RepID=A0A3A9Z933_9ACTN|nr:MFS transporter [Streptomyces hoynatensis]RKN44871.1 MFS transporter [Streptomyces hoynatensis]